MEWNGFFAQLYLCEVDLISVTSFVPWMSARERVTFSERRWRRRLKFSLCLLLMHLDILFSVGKISFFVCKYVICCITLRWSKNSGNVVLCNSRESKVQVSVVGVFHRWNKTPSGITWSVFCKPQGRKNVITSTEVLNRGLKQTVREADGKKVKSACPRMSLDG